MTRVRQMHIQWICVFRAKNEKKLRKKTRRNSLKCANAFAKLFSLESYHVYGFYIKMHIPSTIDRVSLHTIHTHTHTGKHTYKRARVKEEITASKSNWYTRIRIWWRVALSNNTRNKAKIGMIEQPLYVIVDQYWIECRLCGTYSWARGSTEKKKENKKK